ncbi:SpvB/TcaC N-terminal domain-containing protein [Bradyrhizobium sp. CCGE-LA001]|uniref:SpvB/TcaC N-terminal domain-containing protein n=1 Tax=Bradyrhizobium sp. CCGE-LA001 TaxID=1223566 RepID=UPI001313D9B6|nr:SpvB/TcaC N-terminal domain-containing protein [Bradyrhizobium sp. CCGE-LA001]
MSNAFPPHPVASGARQASGSTPLSAEAATQSQSFAANLPKGGGAVRSIDEKASVDVYRGTARLSVPLGIDAVRGGVVPELSLNYESGSGNGPFGIGWNVAAPAISRRTDKGIPRYEDEIGSDRFMAAGSDELVRLVDGAGEAVLRYHSLDGELISSPPASEYYEVRPYIPRVDNIRSRIEWWRRIVPGENGRRSCPHSFWRIISRSNVTSLYGFSAASQLRAPGVADDTPKIFQWQLERSFDDRGNAVLYGYAADDDGHVSPLVASPCYLVSVKYGNATPYDRHGWLTAAFPAVSQHSAWLFELKFDYGHAIGDPSKSIADILALVERPVDKDRCVLPAAGRFRQDSFTSYRSGFAIRTRRLCRRILSYHRLSDAYEGLTRSLELTYEENPYLSKLAAVTQVAWDGVTGKAFPPLQFAYAGVPDLAKARVERLAPDALPTLRAALDRPHYSWIDLDAEGAPGALFRSPDGAWLYARNSGGGRFSAPQPVGYQAPLSGAMTSRSSGSVALLDLGGDGQLEAVEFGRPAAGFRERTADYKWDQFVPFAHSPALDPDDPNVRLFDLDGDGLSDLVSSEQGAYVWQRSLGENGFAPPERLSWTSEEKNGPRLLFADRNNMVYLADMSGDGLTDLVRIRNGEICYWPNLGAGRFGARIPLTIRDADGNETGEHVIFDRSELFSASRIRLVDVDGSGSTDLAYLGADGLRCWRNQSGNGFSRPVTIPFPPIDDPGAVSVVDLLANGTSCLVFAPGSPDPSAPLRYLHFVGGQSPDPAVSPDTRGSQKPHLLVRYTNNRGGETHFRYTTSAQFCIEDRDNSRPWITKLGFPVQVIERVEHHDLVTGKILTNSYRYRHGHYDGQEREFCGFAHVEQRDAVRYEATADRAPSPKFGANAAFELPPTVTRTWFHTGATLKDETLNERLAMEYFAADPEALLLPDTAVPELNEAETRDAILALRGSVLRQELYSGEEDGGVLPGAWPYTVSEHSYSVRRCQPTAGNRHAVFQVNPAQQIDYSYEQRPDDPRVQHLFTLETDEWGNVLQSAHAAYGRRTAGLVRDLAFLNDEARKIQSRTSLTYSRKRYTNGVADPLANPLDHQAALPAESIDWEITGVPPTGPKGFYRPVDATALDTTVAIVDLPYQSVKHGTATRRRIKHNRLHYWNAAQDKALPLGGLALPALAHQSFKLASTPQMIQRLADEAREPVDADRLLGAGYQRRRDVVSSSLFPAAAWPDDADSESWWAPSPFQQYDPKAFFVPVTHFDAFYKKTIQEFGIGVLMPERIVDPAGNETRIRNDYRLLRPRQITDPNGSVAEVRFDLRGMVAATALRGNQHRPTGDTLGGISVNLAAADIAKFFGTPVALAQPGSGAPSSIGSATSRFVHDMFAACDLQRSIAVTAGQTVSRVQPVWAATVARQFHISQDKGATIEIVFAYSNGFGEVAQTKQLTNAGPLDPVHDPANTSVTRWIGSGWQIHDNKNQIVREYEAFFTATHGFEPGRLEGASHTTFYDALQRVRTKLAPHRTFLDSGAVAPTAPVGHSYEKQTHHPWGEETWDANDTVLLNPLHDADVHGFFRKLPAGEVLPTWYQQRVDLDLNQESWPDDEARQRHERECALQTAVHAATPSRTFLDPLGRQFLSVVHHRRDSEARNEFICTRSEYDVEGNLRAVIDTMERAVMRWDYSMIGLPWRSHSMDSGCRILLTAVDGKTVVEWDAMQRRIVHEYDSLRRLLRVTVREAGSERTRESYAYGESVADGAANYLRGRLYRQDDEGGSSTIASYDWHGSPTRTERTTVLPGQPARTETRQDEFDAQSRPVESVSDGSRIARKYSVSGQLIEVTSSPGGAVVTGITYRASGQRLSLRHGGAGPGLQYVFDPLTGRLHSQRAGDFQNIRHIFDPVGNITHIFDRSIEVVFNAGQRVDPLRTFNYDSLYRLVTARGREHCSRTSGTWNEQPKGFPYDLCAHAHDQHAFRNYRETYQYDPVGNMVRQRHVAGPGSWTRSFNVEVVNNRLRSVTIGNTELETLDCDAHGNVVRMAHLTDLRWDYRDRLVLTRGGGDDSRFAYDAAGERVAKSEPRGTRYYLGQFEFFSAGSAKNSSVIRDGNGILAIVDHAGGANAQVRLQIPDHLGSRCIEVDQASGELLAREEYYPYGGTSYQAPTSGAAARRYRFTAKERDESTGLSYHGARYYAPWLGRWISADPAGVVDGPNRYCYVGSNPVSHMDPTGLFESKPDSARNRQEQPRQVQGSLNTKSSDRGFSLPRVEEPGFKESLIPIWGSGKESYHHFQEGNYWRGTLWGALAVSDVFLVKSLATGAGKILWRGGMKLLGREAAQLSLHSSPQLAEAAVPKLVKEATHVSSPWAGPGVSIFREGDWFIKSINPTAGFFRKQWGLLSIESQAKALAKLGDIGVDFTLREGTLWTRSAGEQMTKLNSLFLQRYAQGSLRLRTLFNDIRPRNVGQAGLIFDAAIDDVTKSLAYGEAYLSKAYAEWRQHH